MNVSAAMNVSAGEQLLTMSAVAELLSVPRAAVLELIAGEGLPVVRLSEKRVRVPAAALEAWLAARTQGAGMPAASNGEAPLAASDAPAPGPVSDAAHNLNALLPAGMSVGPGQILLGRG